MHTGQDIRPLILKLRSARRVVALTGSGISAESGIPTFRGKDGLWKTYQAQDLATPEAFSRDPHLVWEWYDWRRNLMFFKQPNAGHEVLAAWESAFEDFALITQNIDGLHNRAGSQRVTELHGNIWKLRCTREGTVSENRETPLSEIPPHCSHCGALMRPHVVWFGEPLDPEVMRLAAQQSAGCEVMFVVGTSAVVYPAASLPLTALETGATVVEINLEPTPLSSAVQFSFQGSAGKILPEIAAALKADAGKDNGDRS
jgi:NAD-dependent deacetylase